MVRPGQRLRRVLLQELPRDEGSGPRAPGLREGGEGRNAFRAWRRGNRVMCGLTNHRPPNRAAFATDTNRKHLGYKVEGTSKTYGVP